MSLVHALRHAARRLRRSPAFAVAAILTLALGIGATTAVFSVVDGVLLRPLPYDHPDRLVSLSHTLHLSGIAGVEQSDATYLYYERESRAFAGIGAYRVDDVNLGALDDGADAGDAGSSERVGAGRVTASLFPVLRATPLRGRRITADDDRPGAPPVVVIGERLWRRKYGGDPGIIGRRLRIDGVEREVVGIMPADFAFPAPATELWLPAQMDPARTESATFDWHAVGRLRDGVSLAAATADLQRLLPRVPEAFPGRLTTDAIRVMHMQVVARPLRDVIIGDVGRTLWVVLAAVGLVLLIACANVANLFLARAEGRQRELAVRRALGAGRGAMLGEFLSEAIVVAVVGGVLGVLLASAGVGALRSMGGGIDVPRLAEVRVDGVVLAVAAGVTALAALLVSALPALRAGLLAPSAVLHGTDRWTTTGRERHRARNALVVSQVALALVLLAGAGLMMRSAARLRAVDPGFEPAHALSFRVALPTATYRSPDEAARFFVRALDAIAGVPGVRAAGVVSELPLDEEGRQDTAVFLEDHPLKPGEMPDIHQVVSVSPDWFRAMGIPIVAGRTFERTDPERAPLEMIVSRSFAERYWKGESAIGKRFRLAPNRPYSTVVGVVGDVHGSGLDQPPVQMVYRPLVAAAGDAHWTPPEMTFVVRTSGDPATAAPAARQAVHALDASLPLYHVRTLSALVAQSAARTTYTLLLLAIASAVALVLGAIGIYGVIGYVVTLRTREIGVRLALGAQPAEVRRMVSRQALAVAAAGVVLGLAGALALTRFLAALLYGVRPTDPVALGGAAAVLLAVAVVASWLPARRAAGVDPAVALRVE